MNRRKELVQQYMEIKTEAGIYCIRNTDNGKMFVAATANLKSLNGRRFELQMGASKNRQLQQEWNEYGEDAFEFEVLDILKKKDSEFFDVKDALAKLEQTWLDRLQPYGDKGYL
ncbi:GIY-YIG nuclease family protein [Paenibacillus farraposensis]|uniref:GIY-YIG nuclease family protein n=1 Tax=Paenibacillus farraposensis TaxID=2807095 RepID=A0ABW4D9A7_9BACL|nr:GIY-YIG nuclease family protein [Paenibacillus farraposensis]MCC3381784.1 GIY-YIG nuclease family protein [Paenibacillus farraposensis]